MDTIWPLPRIEIRSLNKVNEERPVALLTGEKAWSVVSPSLNLPLVVQAEPHSAERKFLDSLVANIPDQVGVIYGVGGGMTCDVAKYVGRKRQLPVVLIPTVLSVDGFFTALVAVRENGTVNYEAVGPADQVVIDWDLIQQSPRHLRGAGIVELLTIVTGLLDWQYAAKLNKTTAETRFIPWAASVMAGIAQQAFKIAQDVGEGKIDALDTLLDLMCLEVQLTNQIGHNRPQEGSEQYFAYAIEPRVARGRTVPYADLVGPGILIASALHKQNINAIRDTLVAAGVRLGQLRPDDILATVRELPQYVRDHRLPYSILNDLNPDSEEVARLLSTTGLDASRARPL
ncbi:MAG: iron-containing alcohol dehydrogenase [Chloroflexi bacterium]|nr:iron-containing alcohol dehydrogenase [Chloroflexota bacterium]